MANVRVLGAADIEATLPVAECIDAIESALRDGNVVQSFVGGVAANGGKFHLKSALGSGTRPMFAAKINANFPDNPRLRALPTIQGVLALFDATDGRLLAIMDSLSITVIRTAAATGVAAKYLAKPDATSAAIIGCGAQARAQLDALRAVRPVRRVAAFDMNRAAAEAFSIGVKDSTDLEVEAVGDLVTATRDADMIVTSTPSRTSFLRSSHVRRGAFIAAVGADNPDKHEIDPELMAASLVVVDDLEQCATTGDLHHAITAHLVDRSHVAGTLADVAASPERFAWRADRTVVFDSTGIPLEDVVAAALVFDRAERSGFGRTIQL